MLEPGKALDRGIKAGETHTYQAHAGAGHYLYAVITPRGTNLKVVFAAPDGKELVTVDPIFRQGSEEIAWILPTAGWYQIVVRNARTEKSGAYELALRYLREPTTEDRLRAHAFQTFVAAEDLTAPATAESLKRTVAKYEEALAGWRTLGDVFWQGRTLHQIAFYWEKLGELIKARDALLAALPLRRATGNRYGEGNSLNNLGIIYNGLGEPAKALECLSLALELRRVFNDRRNEAATLNNLSISYGRMGEPLRVSRCCYARSRSGGRSVTGSAKPLR